MDTEVIVALAVIFSITTISVYAIKRNFDENAMYIQAGYHLVSPTSTVWIK